MGGLFTVPMEVFLTLGSSSSLDTLFNIGSSVPDIDVLDLWHRRLADTSHRIIRESVRNKLVEGIVLDRKYFNLKNRKNYRCPCDICSRAKMHRVSFPAVRDRMAGLTPGAYMSADVLIMQNIPSREGYRYVLFIVDHASKMSWVFPLKTRESGPTSRFLLGKLFRLTTFHSGISTRMAALNSSHRRFSVFSIPAAPLPHTLLVIHQR